LQKILPEAGFIAEEGTAEAAEELNWVIDPVDGTTNFLHNLPIYSTSVALIKGEKLLSGVVYEINADECFYAHHESEAFLNGKTISVSETQNLKESLLATGFPYHGELKMDRFMEMFKYFMGHSHGVRRLGSAAADLVYVACGRLEGFYEFNLNSWDLAAGALIVQKAGGQVSDFAGTDKYLFSGEIWASNGHIHKETLNVLKQYW
jgi:myo-inositol-1(or 4)-monophosphatase